MRSEKPLYSVIAHPAAHLGAYVGLGVLVLASIGLMSISVPVGLAMIAIAILGITMLELVRRADRIALYDDGLAREYKLLSTKVTFAEYESVQDIEVTQSLIERFLDIGTLYVNTSGSHGQEIVFRGVSNPHRLEEAIRFKMRPVSVDTGAAGNVG
jgi:uncharacterized membrane protein YdbT with pleckstrin-like domain